MVGKRPKKVECLTCHGQHAYRVSEPGTRARASSSTTTPKPKKTPADKLGVRLKRIQEKEKELWKETLSKKDMTLAKTYLMSDSYELEDVINHNKFGMGIVTHVITSKKMEVLFEDGYKCMVYNFSQ